MVIVLIYLDNSATTKPYSEVLQTYLKVSEQFFANPSSIHSLGSEVEKLLQQARKLVADLLHVNHTEIVFTSGGTEANNLAIKGIAIEHRNRGKHLITTEIEHASGMESFKQLESLGYEVTYLPVNAEGKITVKQVIDALRDDTILVSVMHVNNEVGSILPIQEIGKLLKEYPKVFFHVDHIQGVSKVPIDVKDYHIDLCTYSSHKFHGPKGVGFLYRRSGVKLSPLLTGGSQEENIRAGTENVPGIVAMTKALRMSFEKAKSGITQMKELTAILREELTKIDGIVINTPTDGAAPHILNISVIGIKPEVLIHALEKENIFVSTKSACSSKAKDISRILAAMGASEDIAKAAIRISLSFENTTQEIRAFVHTMDKLVPKLKRIMG
jgi:cysteine desulfurase